MSLLIIWNSHNPKGRKACYTGFAGPGAGLVTRTWTAYGVPQLLIVVDVQDEGCGC